MLRKGNFSALLVEIQTGAATVENSMELKLKVELPFAPAIPLLGLYPKNPKTPIQKNLCTPMFIAAQFTIAKCWKQHRCPSANEWIKTLWYILHNGILCSRKKELLPFVTAWMELESILPSEVSQVAKDKYHMISPICLSLIHISEPTRRFILSRMPSSA